MASTVSTQTFNNCDFRCAIKAVVKPWKRKAHRTVPVVGQLWCTFRMDNVMGKTSLPRDCVEMEHLFLSHKVRAWLLIISQRSQNTNTSNNLLSHSLSTGGSSGTSLTSVVVWLPLKENTKIRRLYQIISVAEHPKSVPSRQNQIPRKISCRPRILK